MRSFLLGSLSTSSLGGQGDCFIYLLSYDQSAFFTPFSPTFAGSQIPAETKAGKNGSYILKNELHRY